MDEHEIRESIEEAKDEALIPTQVIEKAILEAEEHETAVKLETPKPRFAVGNLVSVVTEDEHVTPFRIKSINFRKGELRLKRI